MINRDIAKIFYQIAQYLEMKDIPFKPQAYEKAAIILEDLKEDVKEIYQKGGKEALLDIPGIGKSMAEKIEEYIKTGKIKEYEELRKEIPVNLEELMAVEGLGPKRIKILYEKLKIKDLDSLELAAKNHKIAPLFGFGEKTEKNILEAIQFLRRSKGRFLLGDILPQVREIYQKLKSLKEVERIDIVGSLRRMKETIGDVDFLVISEKPEKIMDFFVSLPGVVKIWGKGKTKSSVRMKDGFDMDLRVLPKISYGAALQYFTGSKEHNISLRKIAIEKGFKLNEYGLFRGKKIIASSDEKEIYEKLGLEYIPPEMREDQGEIELALEKKLPKIIDYKDIKGDLHCHIKWRGKFDGGENTLEEMAQAALELGYEYLGIASHTKFLKIEHGLDEKELEKRDEEIDKINLRFQKENIKFRLLKGCEANILNDGSLDIEAKTLLKLDFVIAGVHSNFKMSKEEMTERIIKAMRNPNVDIISHPTGRIIQKRDEYQIDFEKILKVARETGTILEINSYPERLDLSDKNIKMAKEAGVKMVINTDSHQKDQLRFIEYGIAQARRGWAEKKDIINTLSLEEMLKSLKRNKK
jgi:DNA polymerase (family 10)